MVMSAIPLRPDLLNVVEGGRGDKAGTIHHQNNTTVKHCAPQHGLLQKPHGLMMMHLNKQFCPILPLFIIKGCIAGSEMALAITFAREALRLATLTAALPSTPSTTGTKALEGDGRGPCEWSPNVGIPMSSSWFMAGT